MTTPFIATLSPLRADVVKTRDDLTVRIVTCAVTRREFSTASGLSGTSSSDIDDDPSDYQAVARAIGVAGVTDLSRNTLSTALIDTFGEMLT